MEIFVFVKYFYFVREKLVYKSSFNGFKVFGFVVIVGVYVE